MRPEPEAKAKIEIKAEGDEATVYIYDVIDDWYGVNAAEFVKAVRDLDAATIHVRINSPGGQVFDARTMATALKQHPSKVVAHIDGLAASAATTIAMAADEVHISQGGFFMIHNAWMLSVGNSDELRTDAGLLDQVDNSIVGDYVARSGQSDEQIRDWMKAETWFSAEEAKAAGFVDVIDEVVAAANTWKLDAYEHPPEALTAPPPEQKTIDANDARDRADRLLRLYENAA